MLNLFLVNILSMIQIVVERILTAWTTLPSLPDWLVAAALLGIYTVISLPIGFKFQFIQISRPSWQQAAIVGLASLLSPALSEELFFRVILLPHPNENAALTAQWGWSSLSLVLFILYHPLNAFLFFAKGRKFFGSPLFLSLAALLGIGCTLSYLQSGSLWMPVFMHWLIVVVWLLFLGGYKKLYV